MTTPNPTEGVSKTPLSPELDRLIDQLSQEHSHTLQQVLCRDLRAYLAARDAKLLALAEKWLQDTGQPDSVERFALKCARELREALR